MIESSLRISQASAAIHNQSQVAVIKSYIEQLYDDNVREACLAAQVGT